MWASSPATARARHTGLLVLTMVVALAAATLGAGVTSPGKVARPAAGAGSGKSLTVLINSNGFGEWPTLDPATDTSAAADSFYLDAIYGNLFEQGAGGKVVPDLATAYNFSNGGKTFTITLRHGVTFTDGTPYDAAAVAYSMQRDLNPAFACLCLPNFPVASITTPTNDTVVLNLTRAYAPLQYAFTSESPNWTISPTSFQRMGEKAFGLHPIGAGPFEVVSNEPNAKLVLKRNPNYWQKGHPKLQNLTFSTVGSDTSGYDALLSGQGQVYAGYGTLSSIKSIKSQGRVTVTQTPSTLGPGVVQLNTSKPPFNNIVAREAVYYATNPQAINKALNAGLGTTDEGMGVPGGLYYQPHVPGYRSYNLTKAKALVKQLGGLSFSLVGLTGVLGEVNSALQSEWQAAGMKVTLTAPETLVGVIDTFHANTWQAILESAGGFDPALGVGLTFRYESDAPFTGVHDPVLDNMIHQAATILNAKQATKAYETIWRYISDKAYSPFLDVTPGYNLVVKGVSGPGLTAERWQVLWEDVTAK
ncbi:MAG: ABC transporter substrate-binding protein [Acidimicrobiales bacterium]|nr:ABC transporter substrate-binding protein [Acidimicrobiales bacterium]MBO0893509.1 ABC transporter substrate-binding protein [Acidimicrobiales bacterium]